MKNILTIILICSCFFASQSQSLRDKVWVQGGGVSFTTTFNGSTTTNAFLDTLYSPYFVRGHSNICNENGDLILISDGYNIYNSQTTLIENGDTIVPNEIYLKELGWSGYAQTSIFLPFPNNHYYLITPTASDHEILTYWNVPSFGRALFDLLLYHKIDMNANAGQGKVVKKSEVLLENVKLSKTNMMACRHGDGINWWLFKQAHDTNMVYKFLVTTDSIYNYGVQGFSEPHFGKWDICGQAMFSEQGNKYAVCISGGGEQTPINPPNITPGKFFVADFDRCTGLLSNPKEYATKPSSCHDIYDTTCMENFTEGLCFSPNGRFLYLSSYYGIKQLDLWDNDTSTQWSYIHGIDTVWDYFNGYSNMYLGPNNKLYIGHWNGIGDALSVIENPDVKGVGCNFCELCLRFPYFSTTTPPCMPNYDLGAAPVGGTCWPLNTSDLNTETPYLLIYPNPASSQLTVELNHSGIKQSNYSLYNTMGQVLISGEINPYHKVSIDISGLPNGIYFIKCEGVIKKFVKE